MAVISVTYVTGDVTGRESTNEGTDGEATGDGTLSKCWQGGRGASCIVALPESLLVVSVDVKTRCRTILPSEKKT